MFAVAVLYVCLLWCCLSISEPLFTFFLVELLLLPRSFCSAVSIRGFFLVLGVLNCSVSFAGAAWNQGEVVSWPFCLHRFLLSCVSPDLISFYSHRYFAVILSAVRLCKVLRCSWRVRPISFVWSSGVFSSGTVSFLCSCCVQCSHSRVFLFVLRVSTSV